MVQRALLSLLFVSTAGVAFASEGGGDPLMDFGFKVVNFLLLAILLHKFAKKPIVNMLNASAKRTKETVDDARNAVADAEKRLAEYQVKVANMEKEIQAKEAAALSAIEEERKSIIEDAKRTAETLEKQTTRRIEQDVFRAKSEIQAFLVEESVKLAEKLVAEGMTDQKQRSLVDEYSKVLEKTA